MHRRPQAAGLQEPQHVGSTAVVPGLQSAGSVIVVHGLSCSETYGIFLDQRESPSPPHSQEDS